MSQLTIGVDLQRSRILYLPVAGFCLLLAAALERSGPRAQRAIALAIVAFHAAALVHNLRLWMNASRIAQAACATAGACVKQQHEQDRVSHVPHTIDGVDVFANGFERCVSLNAGGLEVDVRV